MSITTKTANQSTHQCKFLITKNETVVSGHNMEDMALHTISNHNRFNQTTEFVQQTDYPIQVVHTQISATTIILTIN